MPADKPHQIDYEALLQAAMRGLIRSVLVDVVKRGGLPGDHHFYIAFNTQAAGVVISKRLKERYPGEMTIVLQHRFWDLQVHDDRFEVKLTFDAIPERLVVPFAAIKVFWDPSVPYGHQFEDSELVSEGGRRMADNTSDAPRKTDGSGARDRGPQRVAGDKKRAPAARRSRVDGTPAQPDQGETPVATADEATTSPAVADAPADGTAAAPPSPPAEPASDNKVVSLDKFRKK
jgi:hypothetical protein